MKQKDHKPLVSVIMSCFRESPEELHESIESILHQTLSDFEFLIIVDDKENEGLLQILKEYEVRDSRITIAVQNESRGLAAGRNRGIKMSRGKYIALMDADDSAFPERLEEQLKWIEVHRCDLVFSHMEYIGERGESLGFFTPSLDSRHLEAEIFLRPLFGHPTGFIKREVFEKCTYDETFLRSQDLDLWIRLIKSGFRFCIIPRVLLKYRLHRDDSYEKRVRRQRGYAKYGFRVARKHLKTFWHHPVFWIFYFKRLAYFLGVFLTPSPILFFVMSLKDKFRE